MAQFSLAIHGGAGTIEKHRMKADLEQAYRHALADALLAGKNILMAGGSSVDAVVAAVVSMEDNPLFNAGRGSVLTHDEMVEMDAAVMNGKDLNAGALCGVRHIKNPIVLARDIMTGSSHVMLSGDGAEKFAFNEAGHVYTEQDYFFTERRYDQLLDAKSTGRAALSESTFPDDKKHGTVGAVALDASGNLAAATSTGGLTNKRYGRIGDTPIIGAGTYARNGNCAVSATGMGEVLLRCTVASDISGRMRYGNQSLKDACHNVVNGEIKGLGGECGVVAVDAEGQVHFSLNCPGMYRGTLDTHGEPLVAIYDTDTLTPVNQ
ncbi:isoaspartyl peptidase/L-asparaginase family protein [Veronia pacifica]|uniref:Isoaspartyl peptidase n=1 Tax=Veronia pacifica TaxID=1080227 RepID=A0A1C3EA78_9GAMM|nr:isoaspartyl peptidase/L-asparaginase [Veronia pacifica]ODA30157.1 peptidase [Veronia pacifica]